MADPLSVAGLAIGVVSFGLQVCTSVQTFLDALDARSSEIEAATRHVVNMQHLLGRIQATTDQIHDTHPEVIRVVLSHVKACEDKIESLNVMATDLRGSRADTNGLRSRIQKNGKKLTYPFHRSQMMELESKLAAVNASLHLALDTLHLEMSVKQSQNIAQLLTLVAKTHTSQPESRFEGPFKHLMGSPSYLKEMADSHVRVTSGQLLASNSISLRPSCCCNMGRSETRQRWVWGPFRVYQDDIVSDQHRPECRLSRIRKPSHATKLGIQYAGLARLLSTAVSLSLTVTRGAGGVSISPVVNYCPTVDTQTAPAVSLIFAAWRAMMKPGHLTAVDIMQSYFHALSLLYATGRASPNDIDSKGKTIMYRFIEVLSDLYTRGFDAHMIEQVATMGIQNLINFGVPVMKHDHEGRSPIMTLVGRWRPSEATFSLVSNLLEQSPDYYMSMSPLTRHLTCTENLHSVHETFRRSPDIANACGNGPLSLAVIEGNLTTVASLLKAHPELLQEINQLQQTPVHLAVHNTSCLDLICSIDPGRVLDKEDYPEADAPIHYAVLNGNIPSLDVLLAAGCSVPMNLMELMKDEMKTADPQIISTIKTRIIQALKARREELKAVGINSLPRTVAIELGLFQDSVLDSKAAQVARCLEKAGVTVPPGNFGTHHDYGEPHVEERSIFFGIRSPEELDLLWYHGFRDVNGVMHNGKPPIIPDLEKRSAEVEYINHVKWIIHHGGDFWLPLPNPTTDDNTFEAHDCLTAAHVFMAEVGCLTHDKDSEILSLAKQCLVKDPVDACSCPCSAGGCTPLNMYLKDMTLCMYQKKWLSGREHPGEDPLHTELRKKLNGLFRTPLAMSGLMETLTDTMFHGMPSIHHFEQMVRMVTFTLLEMRHTCCHIQTTGPYKRTAMDVEEVEEINQEQSHLAEILEKSVKKWVDRLEANIQRPNDTAKIWESGLFWKEGTSPAMNFWVHQWLVDIYGILKGLEADGKDEYTRRAQDVGVKWHGPVSPPDVGKVTDEVPDVTFRRMISEIMEAQ